MERSAAANRGAPRHHVCSRTKRSGLTAVPPPVPGRNRQTGSSVAFEDVNCASLNRRRIMNGLIYLVGLIVVIMAILSLFGLR